MKSVVAVTICCVMAGCSSRQVCSSSGGQVQNCGPVALAAYSRIASSGNDSDFVSKITQIYDIIGKKEGNPVNMLDMKQAALASGFDVEPKLLTPDALEGLDEYAIVYVPQLLPKVINQSDPGAIGHFVLVRFSRNTMLAVNPSTLQETALDVDKYPQNWPAFALILQDKGT